MSQKTDNLIKLALVFFVSLLSFSIGTYVGKKYSDNQHKLATLEPQKHETTASTSHEFDSEKEEAVEPVTAAVEAKLGTEPEAQLGQIGEQTGALTDSEVAKLAEEFASDEDMKADEQPVGTVAKEEKPVGTISPKMALEANAKATRTAASATPAHAVETTPSAPTPTIAVKKPVAAPTTPVMTAQPRPTAPTLAKKEIVTEKPLPPVQPTPRDTADEREPASLHPKQEIIPIHYTVQIGSYPSESEASELTKTLQGKGYKTSYIPAKVNGQLWYRVNVGLFGTIKEAQDYKKDFLEKTNLSSAIIQRVQR